MRFPLLILVIAKGGQAGKTQMPKDTDEMPYGEVGFAFFTPRALPAVATKALIIDKEKVVSTFRTLDSTQSDHDVVGIWKNRMDDGVFSLTRFAIHRHKYCYAEIRSSIKRPMRCASPSHQSCGKKCMCQPAGRDRRSNIESPRV